MKIEAIKCKVCGRIGLAVDDTRITSHKCAGQWEIVAEAEHVAGAGGLWAEVSSEMTRLGGIAGYEGREGLEAVLTNIEGTAELARDNRGKELRSDLLAIAAWAVILLDELDAGRGKGKGPKRERRQRGDGQMAISAAAKGAAR